MHREESYCKISPSADEDKDHAASAGEQPRDSLLPISVFVGASAAIAKAANPGHNAGAASSGPEAPARHETRPTVAGNLAAAIADNIETRSRASSWLPACKIACAIGGTFVHNPLAKHLPFVPR